VFSLKAPLMIALLSVFFITSTAQTEGLQVGDTAPSFTGLDQFDSVVSSTQILDSSDNYVLIFYRGSWCKYCKRHLSALSDSLSLILDKNTSVVVVTPETPESRERMESETGAKFSIISDTAYTIMELFKVDYVISKETVPRNTENIIRLTKKSNGNKENVLPIPATYVVGKNGLIKWKHVDNDYTERSTVKQILKVL
jgi:peroxiredoxin